MEKRVPAHYIRAQFSWEADSTLHHLHKGKRRKCCLGCDVSSNATYGAPTNDIKHIKIARNAGVTKASPAYLSRTTHVNGEEGSCTLYKSSV
jgi:hypothetical protein